MKKLTLKIVLVLVLFATVALPVIAACASAETYLVPTPEELRAAEAAQNRTINLTPVINAAIALLGEILVAAISLVILPPLKRWMQAHTSKQQQEKFIALVRELVLAAEQVFIEKGMGAEKMDWVLEELRARGYVADQPLVEAAVHQMNMGVLLAAEGIVMETEPPDGKE